MNPIVSYLTAASQRRKIEYKKALKAEALEGLISTLGVLESDSRWIVLCTYSIFNQAEQNT